MEQSVYFCFVTVYSHLSKFDFIARARALGNQLIMVLIHLESPELHQAIISYRVSVGGQSVLTDKVNSHIPRLLDQVRASIPLGTVLRV
jgi:predicted ABC-type ATPase